MHLCTTASYEVDRSVAACLISARGLSGVHECSVNGRGWHSENLW